MIGREILAGAAGLTCILLAWNAGATISGGAASHDGTRSESGIRIVSRIGFEPGIRTESGTGLRTRHLAARSAAAFHTLQDVAQSKSVQDPAELAAKPHDWPFDEFRIVPVRVHLLRDSETAAAVTRLTEKDIKRIFTKANGIWHAAGIHLWVESIVSEKPASTAGFEHAATLPTNALLPLRPMETRPPAMFHVYYIGEMAPNGIFMRRDGIFVKESARLRAVKGGIDEPLPRVTAHELGHGMGLPHRQDTFNLLASGTTGTSLNDTEIEIVRTTVSKLEWVLTPEQF
jgi:hypothetical protein